MGGALRRHGTTVLVAMVTAAVTAGGPALAHGVEHALFAHSADNVDGKHAVAAAASVSDRAGKLVATNGDGRLPNNIIARAPDAAKLDGMDSTELSVNGYEQVRAQSDFDSTAHKIVTAVCPAGKRAVGGGAMVFPSGGDSARDAAPIVIRWSTPASGGDGWHVGADETAAYGHSWWVSAEVVCVK